MSWKESLQSASYKGNKFLVDVTEFQGGWNIDEKSIPKQEKATKGNTAAEQAITAQLRPEELAREAEVKPISKKAKVFNVSMYFIGDNYLSARDAILNAFDQGGIGELVLPTMGKIKCYIQEWTATFNNNEGGFESINCVFISAPEEKQVLNSIDTASALSGGIDDSKNIIGEVFGYDVSGVADYVFEEAEKIAETLSGSVFDLVGLGDTNDGLNDYLLKIKSFEADVATIIRTPTRYYNEITGLVGGLGGIFQKPIDAWEAQKKLFNSFGSTFKPVNQTTPNREAQANNQDSVEFTVRALAAVEMAGAGSGVEFVSVEEADIIKDTTIEALDEIAEEVGDSQQRQELYDAIIDVKDKFINDVEQNAENLPKSRDITTADSEPAIVIAYDLYADYEREGEVVERNRVINPLFCQRSLDVLSF